MSWEDLAKERRQPSPRSVAAAAAHPLSQAHPKEAPSDLAQREHSHLTKVFRALSDGTRQEILRLLEGRQRTVGEIVGSVKLSQPTISRHLSVLKEANLVVDQGQGGNKAYRLNSEALSSSMREFFEQFQTVSGSPRVTLQELSDPETGRLDAARIAKYLKVPLRNLAAGMRKNYSTVHKTPSALALQAFLRSVKRSLEILAQIYHDHGSVLAWLNEPHPDLGRRSPLEVILQGFPDAVEDMLEAALLGIPS